ncbi:MAG TPA: YfhO family protein [Verrucomicrobiae bacterium]|nr:YfhO family protein [Verrucomicrobiae bacterium]
MAHTLNFTRQKFPCPGHFSGFAALAVVILILLHESLFMGKGLVPEDGILTWPFWNQSAPASNYLLYDQYRVLVPAQEFVYQQKSFPLWNPDLCCGAPNLGAISYGLLFPIRLLLSPLSPFAASGLAAFLKLCLAGWFTILYVRKLGVSDAGSFLAGLAFSLSGFMIVWLGHPLASSAMWLPLVLYLVESIFRLGPEKAAGAAAFRLWAAFGIAYAFMVLGGHPPTTIHVTIVVTIYFFFRLMERPCDQPFIRTGLFIGALVAGFLLAAPQILPFFEYYRQSSSPLASASVGRWASHLTFSELIHFLTPNLMGNPAIGFQDLPQLLGWNGPDDFNERTGYVGIVPLFLAITAVTFRRGKFCVFFLCIFAGSLWIIFGIPPMPGLTRALPILRDINNTRLLLVAGFSLAVLAGLGWDQLKQLSKRRALIVTAIFGAVAAGAFLAFWIATQSQLRQLDPLHQSFVLKQWMMFGMGVIVSLLLAWRPAQPLAALALIWTVIDLLYYSMGYNPAIRHEQYFPNNPAIEWLQKDHSPFRIFGGDALPANCAEAYGLEDTRGCDFMTVRRYEQLVTGKAGDFFFYQLPKSFPNAFPLLNVKYVLLARPAALNPALFDLVYTNGLFIYQYKKRVDRAFIVYNYKFENDPAAILAQVSSKDFDPRKLLLLEGEPTGHDPQTTETMTNQPVCILSHEPDTVKIAAALPRPGYLLLLDTYFPGWSATVNGKPTPILRADYNFRAVPLAAGDSTICFAYRPASLRAGECLCAAGILLVAAAWLLPAIKSRYGSDNR